MTNYSRTTVTGLVDHVRLVPAGTLGAPTQALISVIAALGGVLAGAAIGPLLSRSLPNEALLGAAQACVAHVERCHDIVAIPSTAGAGHWIAFGIGILLIAAPLAIVVTAAKEARGAA